MRLPTVRLRILVVLVAALATFAVVRAAPGGDVDGDPARPRKGILTFTWENDVLLQRDSNYTNGGAVTWTSAEVSGLGEHDFLRKMVGAVSFLPTFRREDRARFATVRFGQEMYTPEDISDPDPPPGEQPYAGILFLDTGVHAMGPRSVHNWTLRLGVVGPASGAEQVQRFIHEITNSPIPQGWDTQLSNEFLLNLDYVYRRRLARNAGAIGFGFDSAANVGAGVGNYYTGASAGINVRFGWCLPDTYGGARVRRNQDALVGWTPPPRGKWRVYFQVELDGYGVARFLPTDGNTFVDSRSTERDDWFALLDFGFVVGSGRFHAAYTYTAGLGGTTADSAWSGQQDYTAITFSWVF